MVEFQTDINKNQERRYYSAAVFESNNPNADKVARVIPENANRIKFGNVDFGYIHDPKISKRRKRGPFDMGLGRLREIEKIATYLFGSRIPDPAGTDDYDNCVAFIRQAALAMTDQDMTAWCRKWAPWANADLIDEVEQLAAIRARSTDKSVRGDVCGRDIGLTWEIRCLSIGAQS